MKPLKKMDLQKPEELLGICADLVFTRRTHLDGLIESQTVSSAKVIPYVSEKESNNHEMLRHDLEFSKKAFYEAVDVQEQLKKELLFSNKAFKDAVFVQEQLKEKIYEPTVEDWLRCSENLLFKRNRRHKIR